MRHYTFGSGVRKTDYEDVQLSAGHIYLMAMNDCLHNHPESSVRRSLRDYQVEFSFDVNRFWFCLTGVKKDVYWKVYGHGADDYLDIYTAIRKKLIEEIRRRGWLADSFIVMKEDVKQIAVVMSPTAEADCGPLELAEVLGAIVQQGYETYIFKGDKRYCNVTALSDELHGFADIRRGYLQAHALNDLSFFRMEQRVLTEENVQSARVDVDYSVMMDGCYQVALALDQGDGAALQSRLETLFYTLLRGSYSLSLCRDALSCFKNILQVRLMVFGAPEAVDLETLCDVERYLKIEECVAALSPVLAALCAAVRERGPCSRPVIQAMYYMKTHYSRDISVQDVADYVNMNANYLSGLFRENTGLFPRDYLIKTRVEAAKELLLEPERKVAEVAAAVGFYDAKYFTRVFKKLTGVSPAKYREEHA